MLMETQSQPRDASHGDLAVLARGGTLNLFGAAASGVATFLLAVVIGRTLHAERAGAFFEVVALFSILMNTAQMGADVGMVRTISRLIALGRPSDVRHTLQAGIVPVAVSSSLLAAGVVVFAPQIARLLATTGEARTLIPYLRAVGWFLPVAACFMVMASATQGFGTMVPAAATDKIGRGFAQLILVFVAVTLGMSRSVLALAWALPYAIGAVILAVWLARLLRKRLRADDPSEARLSRRTLAGQFWRFSAPRGFASMFQVTILWLDTLLIGALRSAREAGIYSIATRYLIVGSLVVSAILQVMGPKISELLATRSVDRARIVYQTATSWLVSLVWPVYLVLAIFGPLLLRIFGHDFEIGGVPLAILAGAMLVSTACGPVDVVLLMGGRSSLSLMNWGAALAVNVGLNLLLIPHMGIQGAAIAWMASILVRNLLPLYQVWRVLGLHPFGRGFATASCGAALCFGVGGLLTRSLYGQSATAFLIYLSVATAVYAFVLWRAREALNLFALRGVVRLKVSAVPSASPIGSNAG